MVANDPESIVNSSTVKDEKSNNYPMIIFQSTLNLLAHILIGIVVGICIIFACRNGLPLNSTNMHIILCVIGYQLLMAEGILALCPHNSWTAGLRLADKKRTHGILLFVGSVLAIAGSVYKSLHKHTNFNTYHGLFGLVAMIFAALSLINGLTSLYAFELRKWLPGNLSKVSHIIFGVISFVTSLISLCYGLDYNFFKNWTSSVEDYRFAYALMAMSSVFTFIIIVNPLITAFNKSRRICN